jgi:hypothetical protein
VLVCRASPRMSCAIRLRPERRELCCGDCLGTRLPDKRELTTRARISPCGNHCHGSFLPWIIHKPMARSRLSNASPSQRCANAPCLRRATRSPAADYRGSGGHGGPNP